MKKAPRGGRRLRTSAQPRPSALEAKEPGFCNRRESERPDKPRPTSACPQSRPSGWYACGMASSKKRREKTKPDPHLANWRGDPAETGAFISAFTFRLPIRMGISDNFEQEIAWPSEYQSPEDAQTFAKPPFVRLRL